MKTFRIGGVHPAENKLSASAPIKVADLPKTAVFPMGQHIGAPATPIVKKGDKVKTKQAIGTVFTDPDNDNKTEMFFQVWMDKDIQNPSLWLAH